MTKVVVLTENPKQLFWSQLWEMIPWDWFNQKYQTKMLVKVDQLVNPLQDSAQASLVSRKSQRPRGMALRVSCQAVYRRQRNENFVSDPRPEQQN